MVIGALFLLTGVYYAMTATEGSSDFNGMMMSLLRPSDDATLIEVTGKGLGILFLYFFPALLALIGSILYAKKFSPITYPASIISALYLIVIQTKVLVINFNYGTYYYPSFFIASLFLFIPILLLSISALLHRNSILLIFACFYFYISVVLYSANYSGRFEYLFPFVLIFSCIIAWVGQRIQRPYINLINFSFAIFFFGLFWLRKFVVNSKPDFLTDYFIFGILFYLLFYAVSVYAPGAGERPLRPWMQLVFTWSNLVFFAGTASYVLLKYFGFGYLWVFALIILLFNLLGLYIIKRYNINTRTFPHHFSGIFLASAVLPLMVHQNMVLLFCAGLSVFMLIYSDAFKNRAAMWISMSALTAMIGDYLFHWAVSYIPSLFTWKLLPDTVILLHGTLSGLAVVVVLLIIQWFLRRAEIPLSKKWFRRSEYSRVIRGGLIFSLFFTMGWIGFSLLCLSTGSIMHTSVGWFITGAAFFIILINYYSGKQSYYKRPMLYFAVAFALLYLPLVYGSMIVNLENLIQLGELNGTAFLLHYIALALLVMLGVMSLQRIFRRNAGNIFIQRGTELSMIIFIIFLLCTEYDNLSALIASVQKSPEKGIGVGGGILDFNRHLPYSIVMWALAVFLFIRSIYRQNNFLKSLSIGLFIGLLIKVFAYDFETLNPGGRSAMFFAVGLFLLGFAILYPRLMRAGARVRGEVINSKRSKE